MPNQTGPDVECVIWHEGIVTDYMVAGCGPIRWGLGPVRTYGIELASRPSTQTVFPRKVDR